MVFTGPGCRSSCSCHSACGILAAAPRIPEPGLRRQAVAATAPDDGTPDVFVHHSAIKADGFRELQENQRVEYTAVRGAKGPQAEEVHTI
jgi:cold shock protein